jgi:hypothetical protein
MDYNKKKMRVIEMVMEKFHLITMENNHWEMHLLRMSNKSTILIQWLWRMQ